MSVVKSPLRIYGHKQIVVQLFGIGILRGPMWTPIED